MKFVCDQCKTKYSIDDARVRGKVLKIRCKQCNHIITVREETAAPRITGPMPAAAPSGPRALERALDASFGAPDSGFGESTVVSSPDQMRAAMATMAGKGVAVTAAVDEWYIAFDGEQEGPLPFEQMMTRIRAEVPTGREAYTWRDGFEGWLPIAEVPEITRALKPPAPAVKPVPPAPAVKPVPSGARPVEAAKAPVAAKPVEAKAPSVAKPVEVAKPVAAKPVEVAKVPLVARPVEPAKPVESVKPTPTPAKSVEAAKPIEAKKPDEARKPEVPVAAKAPLIPEAKPAAKAPPIPEAKPAAKAPPIPGDKPAVKAPPVPEDRSKQKAGEKQPEESAPVPASAPHDRTVPESMPAPMAAAATVPLRPETPPPAPAPVAPPVRPVAPEPTPTVPVQSPSLPMAAKSTGLRDEPVTPLPPPPATDLVITEASVVAPLPTKPTNGHGASAAPVVIISAPHTTPQSPTWLKWAAIGGGLATAALLGVVVMLLLRKPPPPPPADAPRAAQTIVETAPTVIYTPTPVGKPVPSATDPKAPPAPAAAPTKKGPNPAAPKAAALTEEQKRILETFKEKEGSGSAAPALPQAPKSMDKPQPKQHASESQIADVVKRNKPQATQCYERELKRDPSLQKAKVVVRVNVGISGRVTGVTLNEPYAQSALGVCLSQSVRRWNFPALETEYATEFNLLLQAAN